MKNRLKKFLKIAGLALGCLCLFLLSAELWLNSGRLTSAKIKVFKVVPFPMAFVNGQAVWTTGLFKRLDIAPKLGASVDADAKLSIFNQLMEEEKNRQLARRLGVFVSQKEVDLEFSRISEQEDLATALKTYGLSESEFKNQVLRPELLVIKIRLWFNSQRPLNTGLYTLADSLVSKIKQGQDMASLAKAYTEEEVGQQTGGDLGFVDPASLLPELRESVENATIGETAILPSRHGLHIIRKEGQNAGQLHLRQIFLQIEDFDSWHAEEMKNYKVWKLINL